MRPRSARGAARVSDAAVGVTGGLLAHVWHGFAVDAAVREDPLASTLYVRGEQYRVCFDPQDPDDGTIELGGVACGGVY